MTTDKIKMLAKFSDEIANAKNKRELFLIIDKHSKIEEFANDEDIKHILDNARKITERFVLVDSNSIDKDTIQQRILSLSKTELAELEEINRIIDNNKFNYHFQPIVDTRDGSIYSFEALMRAEGSPCGSPFHILKYAEIGNRLVDIERATFLNILSIIDRNIDRIGNRHIFINSIPKARLDKKDLEIIIPTLAKYSNNIVVEMIEQSEMDDEDLKDIKKIYADIGVRIAIDDYGTGYSNVQNLIRYTPDFVKIDRALISNVNSSHKKQHFVREIIEFCHDNEIIALAEGVETQEELQTVIALGVDLVQGYYTARPCATLINEVPENIRAEIKKYREEKDRDSIVGIYRANNIDKIKIDGDTEYHCIVASGNSDSKQEASIRITGRNSSEMTLIIEDNFTGEIILDNTILINNYSKPCIEIGDNCNVRLEVIGSNKILRGGIKVPETSELTICGKGSLKINISGARFFAIGNDKCSRHGRLIFEQGVTIENDSNSGVCIGSGLGGEIDIRNGKFDISMRGFDGVAIGAYCGKADINICACSMMIKLSLHRGVAIGSLNDNVNIGILHSSLRIKASGTEIVGIGTIKGKKCELAISEASTVVNILATNCSAIAAIEGDTALKVEKASLQTDTRGVKAYAVGYIKAMPVIDIIEAELEVNIVTEQRYVRTFMDGKLNKKGGRMNVTVNNESFYCKDY